MEEETLIQIRRRDSDVSTGNSREWIHLLPLADRRDVEALERARQNLLALSLKQKETHAETLKRAQERYTMAERDSLNPGEAANFAHEEDGRKSVTPLTLMRVLRGAQAEHVRGEGWTTVAIARYLYSNIRYQLFQIFLSVLSCAVYVAETYTDLTTPALNAAFLTEEIFVFVCFLFDLFVHLFAADDPRDYLFSLAAVVDILALVPILVIGREQGIGYLRFLRVLKAARLLRIHRLTIIYEQRSLHRRRAMTRVDEVGFSMDAGFAGDTSSSVTSAHAQNRDLVHQVISLTVATVGVVFIASAVVHTIEEKEGGISDSDERRTLDFHDAIYFVIVTITTVGYGDIVPVSTVARIAIALIICVAIIVIPYQIQLLLAVLARRSRHLGSYRRRHVTDRHLVLMGTVTFDSLVTCLRELFHPDHRESRKVHVVILAPQEPSIAILALIRSPEYRARVTYVKGSALNALDLARADVRTAACVTVLVNKQSTNAQREDMGVVLRALSVANFCQEGRRHGAGPRVFTELIQPQATRHLRTAGLRHVICADALKLSLMANSCMCPGLSTLLVNLMRSHSVMPPDVLLDASWYVEYYIGATKQLYVVEFSPQLHHVRFDEAAALIFQEFELVLLGVYKASAQHQDGRVVLNPGHHYAIRRNDFAFVLADSARDAQHIWEYVKVTVDEEDEIQNELARLLEAQPGRGVDYGNAAGTDLVQQKLYAQQVLQSCKMRRKTCTNVALIEEWNDVCGLAPPSADDPPRKTMALPEATNSTPAFLKPPPLFIPPAGAQPLVRTDELPRPRTTPSPLRKGTAGPTQLRRDESFQPGRSSGPGVQAAKHTKSSRGVLAEHLSGVEVSELSGDEARQLLQRIQGDLQQVVPRGDVSDMGEDEDGGGGAMGGDACEGSHDGDDHETGAQDGRQDHHSDASPWVRWKWGHVGENARVRRLAAPNVGAAFEGRFNLHSRLRDARLESLRARHVLVIGMEPSMPHLDCLLRPFRTASAAWIWRRSNPCDEDAAANPEWKMGDGSGARAASNPEEQDAVPVIFLTRPEKVPAFCEALWRLGETAQTAAVIAGSPLSTRDLMRAGAHKAAAVMLLARSAENTKDLVEETLVDSTVLVAFLKLLPLLRVDAHLTVELVYESNLRFLHPLHDESVRRLQDLGDESAYLWPLAAAGKTFSVSSTDALMSQAFYRPPIIYFIEQLLDLSPLSSASDILGRPRHRDPDPRGMSRSHHKAARSSYRRTRSSEQAESQEFSSRGRGRRMRAVGSLASLLQSGEARDLPAAGGTPTLDPAEDRETSRLVHSSALAEASLRDSGLGSAVRTGIYGRRPSRHAARPSGTPRLDADDESADDITLQGKRRDSRKRMPRLSEVLHETDQSSWEPGHRAKHRPSEASSRNLGGQDGQRHSGRHHSSHHHHHHHHHHHAHHAHKARMYTIAVPEDLFQHSYGELYQQLVAPPLNLVAVGLYRRAGTRNSVEPYVYTSPRADTVLHEGDRVFVLGEPNRVCTLGATRRQSHSQRFHPEGSPKRDSPRQRRSASMRRLGSLRELVGNAEGQ